MNLKTSKYLKKIDAIRYQFQESSTNICGADLCFYNRGNGKPSRLLAKRDSTDSLYGRLLYKIVKRSNSKNILELGTCIGISASYMKAAQSEMKTGRLISLEGIDTRAELAEKNMTRLGFTDFKIIVGQFSNTLYPTLKKYGKFDLVFIDGHHKLIPTLRYLKQIIPFVSRDGLIIIDDLNLNSDMEKVWVNIIRNESLKSAVRLDDWGILRIL